VLCWLAPVIIAATRSSFGREILVAIELDVKDVLSRDGNS